MIALRKPPGLTNPLIGTHKCCCCRSCTPTQQALLLSPAKVCQPCSADPESLHRATRKPKIQPPKGGGSVSLGYMARNNSGGAGLRNETAASVIRHGRS